jgi:tRNA(Phe) wybutosine-synthesizing methylase Tyw3
VQKRVSRFCIEHRSSRLSLAALNPAEKTASGFSDDGGMRHRQPSAALLHVLAENLRRWRLARGYTQAQLARACGLPASYIGDIEQATVNITLANLEALSVGLVSSPAELLTRAARCEIDVRVESKSRR